MEQHQIPLPHKLGKHPCLWDTSSEKSHIFIEKVSEGFNRQLDNAIRYGYGSANHPMTLTTLWRMWKESGQSRGALWVVCVGGIYGQTVANAMSPIYNVLSISD